MLKLLPTTIKRAKYAKSEMHVDHFIPYQCHWDQNTILTKKNELLQVIKIDGYSFETADDDDLDNRKHLRNLLLKNMASGNITLYFHTIRRKKPIAKIKENNSSVDPTLKIANDFMTYLTNEWDKRYAEKESFFNELYISILYKPDTDGAAIIQHLAKKLQQSSDKTAWENDMREMAENLTELSNRVLNTFRDYGANLLGVYYNDDDGIEYCEILEFFRSDC